jgi:hypothetical protein
MIKELRRKVRALENSGIDLNHVEVKVKRDGRSVTSDVAVLGGGSTLLIPNPDSCTIDS